MPRKTRIDAPGALRHIIIRGIERRAIFRIAKDREEYLKRLGDILPDTPNPLLRMGADDQSYVVNGEPHICQSFPDMVI